MWQNLKQKDRAVLPKSKLIVYMSRSQKSFLNQTQAPKKDPKGPKSAKMAPNLAKLKRKRQTLIVYISRFHKYF